MATLSMKVSRFGFSAFCWNDFDKNVPGKREIELHEYKNGLINPRIVLGYFCIDSRDNSIFLKPFPVRQYDFPDNRATNWFLSKFQEYKDSNFKFGNDLYDPTEQITVEGFFNYLHKCMRDEVLTEIIQ